LNTWASVKDNAQISEGYTFDEDSDESTGIKLKCIDQNGKKQRCRAVIPESSGTKLGIEIKKSDDVNFDALIAEFKVKPAKFK